MSISQISFAKNKQSTLSFETGVLTYIKLPKLTLKWLRHNDNKPGKMVIDKMPFGNMSSETK